MADISEVKILSVWVWTHDARCFQPYVNVSNSNVSISLRLIMLGLRYVGCSNYSELPVSSRDVQYRRLFSRVEDGRGSLSWNHPVLGATGCQLQSSLLE